MIKKALKKIDARIEALRAERQALSDLSERLLDIEKLLRTEHLTNLTVTCDGTVFVHAYYRRSAKQMAPLLEELSTKLSEFNIERWHTSVTPEYVQFSCFNVGTSICLILNATDMDGCVLVPKGKKTIGRYETVEVDDYAVLCPEESQ